MSIESLLADDYKVVLEVFEGPLDLFACAGGGSGVRG